MVFHAAELMRVSVAGIMEDSELLKALRGAKPGWTQQVRMSRFLASFIGRQSCNLMCGYDYSD